MKSLPEIVRIWPEITQVSGLMLTPAGRLGDATQLVMLSPLEFNVVGEIVNVFG